MGHRWVGMPPGHGEQSIFSINKKVWVFFWIHSLDLVVQFQQYLLLRAGRMQQQRQKDSYTPCLFNLFARVL